MFLLTGHNGKIEFSSVMKLNFLKFFQYVIGKYDGGFITRQMSSSFISFKRLIGYMVVSYFKNC